MVSPFTSNPPADTSRFGRPRTQTQRWLAQLLWCGVDLIAIACAASLAAFLSEPLSQPGRWLAGTQLATIAEIALVQLAVFQRRGLYRTVLRYSGIEVLTTIFIGVAVAVIVAVVTTYFLRLPNTGSLGRTFLVIYGLLAIPLSGSARLAARLLIERKVAGEGKPVLIYGSGSLGEMVLRELRNDPRHAVVGFLDDDPTRAGALIRGCKVLGGLSDLVRLRDALKPALLVIAERKMPQSRLRQVFQICLDNQVQVKVVAGSALQNVAQVQLNDLALEDLLRRPPRSYDRSKVDQLLAGKTVMITGAGGSLGSELCRQIAAAGASELILIDHSEYNLYQIDDVLRAGFPNLILKPVLATLADRDNLDTIIATCMPQLVFHAAAYKHVPMVEENAFLGMANNLGGFSNLLSVCIAHRIEQVVMISTDKAVRPTNVMGASKRACEVLMQNIDPGTTRLCAVRFGNVLGSSGSVIPHFLAQIRRGGPVTVTHPDVSRYFMLLPEAVELVLHAGAIAKHGEIFILDMGEPVRIVNLARQLIFMTGHVPDQDIRISFTGLRPGEKLTEELLIDEAEQATTVDGITIARATRREQAEVREAVEGLLAACRSRDLQRFIDITCRLVPEWRPSAEFNNVANGQTDIFLARRS